MEDILNKAYEEGTKVAPSGNVASYIPELEKGNPEDVGFVLMDLKGNYKARGQYLKRFTLQSITKVITLLLALEDIGEEEVFKHVHMEPTGDPFNSIMSFEVKNPEKPFNPMINAGAMVVTSLIRGEGKKEKIERILKFTSLLTGNAETHYDRTVYLSEKATGNRNRSLAYFMKSTGIMKGDPEEILDLYFMQCSILGTCKDIATIGAVLAANGIHPVTGERVIRKENARIVKTIMTTCGMYDASGEFAVSCGVPAKSGVGGGILGAVPGRYGIGTFGPALDAKGNSIAGIRMMEYLSRKLELSIFQIG
jgi:glutaminase